MNEGSRSWSWPTSEVEMVLGSRSAIVRMLTLLMQRSVSACREDVLEGVARGAVHVVSELQRLAGGVVGDAAPREQRRPAALAQQAGLCGGGGAGPDRLLGQVRAGAG